MYYKFQLANCLSFSGNIATSAIYQKITKLILVQNDLNIGNFPETLTTADEKKGSGAGIVELSLGLEYGTYFYRNNYHFNGFLGYDFQGITSIMFTSGNLLLHGLNVNAKFDF